MGAEVGVCVCVEGGAGGGKARGGGRGSKVLRQEERGEQKSHLETCFVRLSRKTNKSKRKPQIQTRKF